MRIGLLAAVVLFSPPAFAQRPSEDDMFGAPASQPAVSQPSANQQPPGKETNAPAPTVSPIAPAPPQVAPTTVLNGGRDKQSRPASGASSERDEEALQPGLIEVAFLSGRVKDNPLTIGGLFYLSAAATGSEHTKFTDSQLQVPLLVNLYADARPTDRVRAQVLARMQFDPFLSSYGLPSSTPLQNPSVQLDQAWLSFDIAHRVFVTAGRQHVKWGTAHIFTPTDFLASQFRDPLSIIDTRTGVTMLKASVPWEAKGWNFYAVAVFEPTQLPATGLSGAGTSGAISVTATNTTPVPIGTTIGNIGGAARAEVMLGGTQIGLDGLVQKGRHARAGLDITSPVGPLDLYAEAALKNGSDFLYYNKPLYSVPGIGTLYGGTPYEKPVVQAAGGVSSDIALPGNRNLTLGGEYFYNSIGYTSSKVYPTLLFSGAFQPFYNGQHYGAVTVAFNDNETRSTYTLSNIGNFSDMSFITRLDFSILVISYLTVLAWADVHYGQAGGELRFQLNIPANLYNNNPAYTVPAPIADVGVGLRVSL